MNQNPAAAIRLAVLALTLTGCSALSFLQRPGAPVIRCEGRVGGAAVAGDTITYVVGDTAAAGGWRCEISGVDSLPGAR